MNTFNSLRILAVLGVAAGIGSLPTGNTAPGDPVISQRPLTQTARIKPAFIMALDNSGSMSSDETLCKTSVGVCYWNTTTRSFFDGAGVALEGGTGYAQVMDTGAPRPDMFGASRDPEYNRAYFDPAELYPPWMNYDGTPEPDSPINAAKEDPGGAGRPGPGTVFDFTAKRAATFRFTSGTTLYAGTEYFNNALCNNSPTPGFGPVTNSWITLAANLTFTGTCDVNFQYWPAVVYLSAAAPPPTGFTVANRVQINGAGPAGADLYKYEIIPANFANGADYTANVQNFANWWTYYGNRNRAVIASATQALIGVDFMRVGSFRINPANPFGNTTVMHDMADNSVGGGRNLLYNDLRQLDASGNTPTRRAAYRLGTEFRRTDPGAPIQLACQVNAGMLFTDGYINESAAPPPLGNLDGALGAPFADTFANTMADIATWSYVNNLRPDLQPGRVAVPSGCSSGSPDPRLDCQRNPHMNYYGITLGARGEVYDVNVASTNDPYANPPNWTSNGTENLTARQVDEIWHATLNSRGKFINASSPAAVRDAMRDVLNAVNDASLLAGTIAGSGSRVPGDNVAITVEPTFRVGNNGTDWAGELTGYRVNADGSIGAAAWTASSVLPAAPSRNIHAITTAGDSTARQVFPFIDTNLGATPAAQFTALGLSALEISVNFPAATPSTMVAYLRGDQSQEIDGVTPTKQYRTRSNVLGDIVNSAPVISSGKDDYGWEESLLDPTYAAFLIAKATRRPMVYVGANDGMLHAFDAETGIEQFAVIPKASLENMGELPFRLYPHRFYVDGEPVVTDAKIGGGWKTVLAGTTAAGGRSVFMLNVDNPPGFISNDVMWEFNSGLDGDMGHSFGRPVIVPLQNNRWGVIFGNGYGNDSNDPYLYVLDAETGVVLAKLRGNDGSTAYNGLGQVAVIDRNSDGKADTVYGGDLLGNVWKFDLSAPNAAGWNVAFGNLPLFTATDALGNPQPITGDLEVATGSAGGAMVYFGTGRYFADGDNNPGANPPVQSVYGVLDRFTGVRAGTRTNLVQQSITAENSLTLPSGAVAVSRQTTTNAVLYGSKNGFFMDLGVDVGAGPVAKGEMFIGTPRIQNGIVFFTTFEPVGDGCTPGGQNWIYGMDLVNGSAALQNVQIDNSGTPACSGSCGGLAIAQGAPVTKTSVFIPRPPEIPGLTCDPADPLCVPPANPLQQCTLVIRAAGSPPLILPRPCGRQSWRQVR